MAQSHFTLASLPGLLPLALSCFSSWWCFWLWAFWFGFCALPLLRHRTCASAFDICDRSHCGLAPAPCAAKRVAATAAAVHAVCKQLHHRTCRLQRRLGRGAQLKGRGDALTDPFAWNGMSLYDGHGIQCHARALLTLTRAWRSVSPQTLLTLSTRPAITTHQQEGPASNAMPALPVPAQEPLGACQV